MVPCHDPSSLLHGVGPTIILSCCILSKNAMVYVLYALHGPCKADTCICVSNPPIAQA